MHFISLLPSQLLNLCREEEVKTWGASCSMCKISWGPNAAYPLPVPAETMVPLFAPPLPGMCSSHLFTWSTVSISWDPGGWHKVGPFCGFLIGCFGWTLQGCCGDLRLSYQSGVSFFLSIIYQTYIEDLFCMGCVTGNISVINKVYLLSQMRWFSYNPFKCLGYLQELAFAC